MTKDKPVSPEALKLHEQACLHGEEYYFDPESGLLVYTRIAHLERGYCCRSGCRHCPYGFKCAGNES